MRTERPALLLALALASLAPAAGLADDSGPAPAAPCVIHADPVGNPTESARQAILAAQLVITGPVLSASGRVLQVRVQVVYKGEPGFGVISVGPESPDLLYGSASCRSGADLGVSDPRLFLLDRAPRLSPALPYDYAVSDSVWSGALLTGAAFDGLQASGLKPRFASVTATTREVPLGERLAALGGVALVAGLLVLGALLLMLGARGRVAGN
ncbi:MAG: hypothetical protein ACYDAY_02275 [Candidatus Dormibacteria bacterium]